MKLSVSGQFPQIFGRCPFTKKIFNPEIRWKKLIFMRCKHIKKEITVQQNNFEIVFFNIKSEMILQLVQMLKLSRI